MIHKLFSPCVLVSPWEVRHLYLYVYCPFSDHDFRVEVCSAHPTSGGPYFWAAMLSRPQNAALASWVTGWFNLLGQVAVTTGIRFVHTFLRR